MKQVWYLNKKSVSSTLLALVIVLMGVREAQAQDPRFAQFFASPMTLNPALIGKGVNDWRALASYRSQWQGEGTQPFTTTAISVEKNLSKNDKNILGVGMMFLSDASNNGLLKNNYLSAGVAYNNALDAEGKQYFGGGLTVNYSSRLLNVSKFLFQSQFGSEGFDPTLPSNDYASIPNNHYIDVNAGLHYSIQSERSGFYTGLSYFHAAGPQDGLSQKFTINPRLGVQAGYQYYFANRSMLHVGGLYEKQGQHHSYTLGLLYKQPVTESALGLRSINIGAWNRFGDAVSVYFGFESNSWLLGITYDAITSKINSIQSLQSLEFSVGVLFGKKKTNEQSRGLLMY